MSAVLPQHVPPPYCDFFDANDAVLHGARGALQLAQDKYKAEVAYMAHNRSGARSGPMSWIAKLLGSQNRSLSVQPLDADAVMEQCQYHATMLQRAPHHLEQLLRMPSLQLMIQGSASRMLEGMLADLDSGAFPGTSERAFPRGCT